MSSKTLESFKDSLANICNSYAEGECELEDVINYADKVMCFRANKGINTKRLEYNEREQAFHDQWMQENAPIPGVNCGHGILQDLFIEENPFDVLRHRKIVEEISNRDRMIVATVIQWLGSNVGMAFLSDSLARFGAKITYTK